MSNTPLTDLRDPAVRLYERRGIFWDTMFEGVSTDALQRSNGWAFTTNDTAALASSGGGLLELFIGTAQAGKTLELYQGKIVDYAPYIETWDRNRRFKVVLETEYHQNFKQLWIIGYASIDAPVEEHVGFRLAPDGTLYGSVGNGVAETATPLMTYDTLLHGLEARYIAKKKAEFYVDNVLKGTITSGLPSGLNYSSYLLCISIKSMQASVISLYVSAWKFLQEP